MAACALQRLGEYLKETLLWGSIQKTLYWDQNTSMPISGVSWRSQQFSLLAKYLHDRQTSKQFEDLLMEARLEYKNNSQSGDFDQATLFDQSRNLEILELELVRQKSLDPSLVIQIASAQAKGYSLWQQARETSDYFCFAPALRTLIELRQEQARQLSEPRSCWETLAQPFEPDLSTARLEQLFSPLRTRLPDLLERVHRENYQLKDHWDLDEFSQKTLADRLLNEWGRDPRLSCVARSPHPFSITLGPQDFRLTTRVVRGQPLSCFLAAAHEWGHSLYEQGLPTEGDQWFSWPIGQATSMGLHESQSLFWENRVARSFAFSERFWPYFKQAGAPVSNGMDLWRGMNPLVPGVNRVEADELSYGIHILIRTDLEIALLEQGLAVDDLPQEWNRRYKDLLGVVPRNDKEGCLQDVHWSEGQFGYFPSYLLGHLISAQLCEEMKSALSKAGVDGEDPLHTTIRDGQENILLGWLREEVHSHGRKSNAEKLVEKVTGKALSSSAFLNYLEAKLDRLIAGD